MSLIHKEWEAFVFLSFFFLLLLLETHFFIEERGNLLHRMRSTFSSGLNSMSQLTSLSFGMRH